MKRSIKLLFTRKSFMICCLLSVFFNISAQDIYLHWAKVQGGNGFDMSNAIEVDGNGKVYTTGSFMRNSSDFDPGAGVFNMISSDTLHGDIFVSRLDDSGNFDFAYSMGSSYNKQDQGIALIADGDNNIFIAGYSFDTTDFNPSNSVIFNLISWGQSSDGFISKLNSNNSLQGAKENRRNKRRRLHTYYIR